ncbi:hypothetical protein BC940DRAFT_302083 [Gongronella butleri]|nr:hypothetical protein BC940DRAFT_302083 [Gongronella butleri]
MGDSDARVPEATERTRLLASSNGRAGSYQVVSTSTDVSVPIHDEAWHFDDVTDQIQHILVYGKTTTTTTTTTTTREAGSSGHSSGRASPSRQDREILVGDEPLLSTEVIEGEATPPRKRDVLASSLKFATEKWMDNQGLKPHELATSAAAIQASTAAVSGSSTEGLGPLPLIQHDVQPNNVQQVWDVAKNASACAVLGLLSERRQGKMSLTQQDGDATLQRLALSTLEHGIKQTSAKDMLKEEMLLKPLLGKKSALQWAVENDCHIFLDDENVQSTIQQSWRYGDIEWHTNPSHPFRVWDHPNRQGWQSAFAKQWLASYLARWASPRYQNLIAIFSGLVYLAFHVATLLDDDYIDDGIASFEYFYYVLVVSDMLLELWRVMRAPRQAFQSPGTYISLGCAVLLTAALVMRCTGLCAHAIEAKYKYIYASYVLLTLATPLLVFRIFLWVDSFCWNVYKINYVVRECFVGSLWVYEIGLVTLLGFWLALAALQRDDVPPLLMLQHLLLGALHAPEIGDTLYFQPKVAGVLLIGYLLVMVVFLGAMLFASFVTTMIMMAQRVSWDKKRRHMEAERCSRPPEYGVFIPYVAFALIFGAIAWLIRTIKPRASTACLTRVAQVVWFIVFFPIILVVAVYDLLVYLVTK